MPKASHVLDVPAAFRDLLDAPFATMGTIGPDGRPHLSEVWFLHEDGELKVSLHENRQKTKNLRRDTSVSLFILDVQNPLRYLEVRGDASLEDDDGYAFASRLGVKYDADLREMDGDDQRRVVVTIDPDRVVAVDLSS